jgi:hypothetical protein
MNTTNEISLLKERINKIDDDKRNNKLITETMQTMKSGYNLISLSNYISI